MNFGRILAVTLFLFGFGVVHEAFGSSGGSPSSLGEPSESNKAMVMRGASLSDPGENAWYRQGALLAGVAAVAFTFLFAASGSKGPASQR